MVPKLFTESFNSEWVFDSVNQNMLLINNVEDLTTERLTPKKFNHYSTLALSEWSNLPVSLEKRILPANTLLPIQNRLNAAKSLFDQITNKWDSLSLVFKDKLLNTIDGPQPVLVFANKYIVDGHHRWSQYMLSNPSAELEVLNIPVLRPTSYVYKIQQKFVEYNNALDYFLACNKLMTLVTLEEIIEEENRKNSYKMSLDDTKKYLDSNITDFCIETLFENKQLSKPCKQEAVDFYINNLQYFLPLS